MSVKSSFTYDSVTLTIDGITLFLQLFDVQNECENTHSCINTYAHSCLKPLSNQTKAMFKSWNSRAV